LQWSVIDNNETRGENMKLHNDTSVSVGTWNVDYLLKDHEETLIFPDGRRQFMRSLTEMDMMELGAPTCNADEFTNDKGYGAEWYFETKTGHTIGIGFRWEIPRLRGSDTTTTAHAIELIDWISASLKKLAQNI
jgi:hypothetical protein